MVVSQDKLFLALLVVALALAPRSLAQVAGPEVPGAWDGLGSSHSDPSQRMGGSGAIVGSVRTLDGKPVANAQIIISSAFDGQSMTPQYTSQDGSFAVTGLTAGTYQVTAQSGVLQASEQVHINGAPAWLTLRLPRRGNAAANGFNGGAGTVSLQQLRVPDKASSFLGKAQKALAKDKLDEADKYISRALQVYPEYAEALAMRGVLKLQAGQLDQAAADAEHAIHADPNSGTGYLVMGAVLNAQHKFQQALAPLSRAETLMPAAWQGYFESSKALLQVGKYEQALRQINRAFSLTDAAQHPDFHLIKGYAYVGLRTYSAALGELQQYLQQAPAGPETGRIQALVNKVRPLAAAAVPR